MNIRPAPFLVGEHLALDFLNTIAVPVETTTEWLVNGVDLVDWLEHAGAIRSTVANRFRPPGDRQALDEVASQARILREWWRGFLQKRAGAPLDATDALADLMPLNRLLAVHGSYSQITADTGTLSQHWISRASGPDLLLQPVISAMADLVCHEDLRLIRSCEGAICTLMFLDRTKAHARRWCSMATCGNRAKAAAHRARSAHRL